MRKWQNELREKLEMKKRTIMAKIILEIKGKTNRGKLESQKRRKLAKSIEKNWKFKKEQKQQNNLIIRKVKEAKMVI